MVSPGQRRKLRFWATVLCATGFLAACGGAPEPTPEAQVREKLAQFDRATAAKDYRTLCTQVYSPLLTARTEAVGLPCPVALRQALADVREPRLSVGKVTVADQTARAQVRTSAADQAPSRDTLELRRERGGWRIVSLAGGSGARSPTPEAEER